MYTSLFGAYSAYLFLRTGELETSIQLLKKSLNIKYKLKICNLFILMILSTTVVFKYLSNIIYIHILKEGSFNVFVL